MTDFILNAQARTDLGKGASRRLRRLAAQVPAVVYGGDKEPASITMLAKEVAKLFEKRSGFQPRYRAEHRRRQRKRRC